MRMRTTWSRTLRCHSRESGNPALRSVAGGYWIARFRACEIISPHPEERPPKSGLPDFGNLKCRNRQQPISKAASRRMDARPGLAAILRDAVLHTAPQDEVVDFFTCSFAGDDTAV